MVNLCFNSADGKAKLLACGAAPALVALAGKDVIKGSAGAAEQVARAMVNLCFNSADGQAKLLACGAAPALVALAGEGAVKGSADATEQVTQAIFNLAGSGTSGDLKTQLDLAVEQRNPSLAAAIRARGGCFGAGLALACKAKDEALALAYVAAGANGNERDCDGHTALSYCYGGGLGGALGAFKGSLKEAGAAIKAAGGHV